MPIGEVSSMNFNDAVPAAPSGKVNIKWQAASPIPVAVDIVSVTNSGGLFQIVVSTATILVTNGAVTINSAFAALDKRWRVTVVNSTTFTLQGSTYSAGWTSAPGETVLPARDVSAYVDPGGGSTGTPFTEVPSGAKDSINKVFTLTHAPIVDVSTGLPRLELYLNGVLQLLIFGTDYTFSGTTITFVHPPVADDWILAIYTY